VVSISVILGFVENAEALILTVNSNLPDQDGKFGDGKCDTGAGTEQNPYTGVCTFFAAQNEIQGTPGEHIIRFSIPMVATPNFGLVFEAATNADKITIDGGSDPNNPVIIEGFLSGFDLAEFNLNNIWMRNGLFSVSGSFVQKCNVINSYFTSDAGIRILTPLPQGCTITGNHVGFKPDGSDEGNGFGIAFDLFLDNSIVAGNVIGNSAPDPDHDGTCGNSVSAPALRIHGDNNKIFNNKIGTDPTGMLAKPNHEAIFVAGNNNEIYSNLISGNGHFPPNLHTPSCWGDGLLLTGSSNEVYDNLIGTDITGNAALPNTGIGIFLTGNNNCIGGKFEGANCLSTISTVGIVGNVLSGNLRDGIFVDDVTAVVNPDNNVILNNIIGKARTGLTLLGNGFNGITIFSNNNDIVDNLIVGSGFAGISLISANQNIIRNNFIGTDGNISLPNSFDGIFVSSDSGGNTIGGQNTGGMGEFEYSNIISGNSGDGIRFEDNNTLASPNLVFGNAIGINNAMIPIGNTENGISIIRSSGIEIGFDELNAISGNGMDGIFLEDSNNVFTKNNLIGETEPTTTSPIPSIPIPNGGFGVQLTGTSTLKNNAGGTMTLADGMEIKSGSTLNNEGIIHNVGPGSVINVNSGGTIDNSGTIDNESDNTITNKGDIENSGSIENKGELTNFADGTINNPGTIDNQSSPSVTGSLINNLGAIFNDGTMINSGTISTTGTIDNSGTIDNKFLHDIINFGTITNNNPDGIIKNSGNITNKPGGIITNNSNGPGNQPGIINNPDGVIKNSGTFNNFGTIINNSDGDSENGGIENSGTITNNQGGTITNNEGSNISNSKTITNNLGGTITNNSYGSRDKSGITNKDGGTINNFGIINNDPQGTPDTQEQTGILNQVGGEILNPGDIKNSGGTSGSPSFVNEGSVNNSGAITNDGFFANRSNPNTKGIIDNSGTITNNSGDINNAGFRNNGIINNNMNGMITNLGFILNSGALKNNNGGTISNLVTITNDNSGKISNSGNIINSGIIHNDFTIDNDGTITNFDTINNSGTITNSVSGTINNSTGPINNSGNILNCGTYTGDLPSGNAIIPCDITEDTTISSDLVIPQAITLSIRESTTVLLESGEIDNSGTIRIFGDLKILDDAFLTNHNFIEILPDGSVNIESGGKLIIKSGGTVTGSGP